MLIQMKMSMAGHRFSLVPGDIVDTDDLGWDAEKIIKRGYAVAVSEDELEPVESDSPKKAKK